MKTRTTKDGYVYTAVDTHEMLKTADTGLQALRSMTPEAREELLRNLPVGTVKGTASYLGSLDQKLLGRSPKGLEAIVESQQRTRPSTAFIGGASRLGELVDAVRFDQGPFDQERGDRIKKVLVDIAQAAGLTNAQLIGLMRRLEVVAGLRDEKTLAMAGMPIQKKIDTLSFAEELTVLIYRPMLDAIPPPK